ncbi:hypothetical protein ANO11243_043040 [Dothideomycetidae sp. 11243]|nr:hypothetical protein ANO11243_043040 [fungal sp. No.11243]
MVDASDGGSSLVMTEYGDEDVIANGMERETKERPYLEKKHTDIQNDAQRWLERHGIGVDVGGEQQTTEKAGAVGLRHATPSHREVTATSRDAHVTDHPLFPTTTDESAYHHPLTRPQVQNPASSRSSANFTVLADDTSSQ